MSTPDQIRQNVAEWHEHGGAFSPKEQKALNAACEVLASVPTVPCTNCRYCVKDCPQQIAIPEIMNLLNLEVQTENTEFAKQQYSWQAAPGPCERLHPMRRMRGYVPAEHRHHRAA